MKVTKIIVLLTTMCMLCGLVACGDDADTKVDDGQVTIDEKEVSDPSDAKEKTGTYDEITEEVVRNHAVTDASDFEYEKNEYTGEITITDYIGKDAVVVFPEEIDGCPVIGSYNFFFANDEYPHVKGVFFPESVKELNNVFGNNSTIEVVIAEGVEVLGTGPFLNCAKLHTLILGENLKEISALTAIGGVPSLKEVYLPPTLETIAEGTFSLAKEEGGWFGEDFTVKGKSGSYIETYCTENDIKFEAVE